MKVKSAFPEHVEFLGKAGLIISPLRLDVDPEDLLIFWKGNVWLNKISSMNVIKNNKPIKTFFPDSLFDHNDEPIMPHGSYSFF